MWDKIRNFFNGLIRNLWKVLKKVISSALEMFLAELLEFAKETVKGLMASDLSNDAKRKKAFDKIKVKALEKGMDYKDHWINMLIEVSLAAIKKEF